MTNQKLKTLTPELLVENIFQSVTELMEAMGKPNNEVAIYAKRKKAETLHAKLVETMIRKKSDEHPGYGLSY